METHSAADVDRGWRLGKTRLALRIARQVSAAYPDGVWLVELAALADPALAVKALAVTLGVRQRRGR